MLNRVPRFLVVTALLALPASAVLAVTNGTPDIPPHAAVGWIVGVVSGANGCDGFGQAILCSGVLVAPDVVISTAYCAYSFDEALQHGSISEINVILDAVPNIPGTATADCSKFVPVSQVHVHPDWEADPFHGNVGVFLLTAPQSIAPAQLPKARRLNSLNGKQVYFRVVSMGGQQVLSGGTDLTTLSRRQALADIPRRLQVVDTDAHVVRIRPGGFGGQACVREINQGGGVFVRDSNELISIVEAGSVCETFGTFQRLDTPNVRVFLEQFMTLP